MAHASVSGHRLPRWLVPLRALRHGNFATLWVANLLSNLGTWMQQIAEPWLVLTLSHSPFLLGVDSFASDAPIWLLVLQGGLLADQRDRRRVALWFQGLQWLCPLALVVLLLLNRATVWFVIGCSLIVGITDALSMPSIQSMALSLVEPEEVPSAVTLNATQFNLSRVLGPMLAGVVMASLGAVACFAINAATYVPFLLGIFFMPTRRLAPPPARDGRSETPSVLRALSVAMTRRQIRTPLLTVFVTGLLCGPVVTFLPVFARDVLHTGVGGFGAAVSSYGVGGLVGAAIVLAIPDKKRLIASLAFAAANGALVLGLALQNNSWTFLACAFGAGLTTVASNTTASSHLQSSIPEHYRGRASSLWSLALRGGMSLGSVAAGAGVSLWGAPAVFAATGSAAIVVQLFRLQLLRNGDSRRSHHQDPGGR
jgi:MFS family permease